MLKQAFGDNSLGQTQTYDWYKHFKNGQTSTDDDDHLGRPSTGIFYIDRIVHKKFVPPGQTVNKEFYRDVLRCLKEDTRRKHPEK
jgi:hypothetical protein